MEVFIPVLLNAEQFTGILKFSVLYTLNIAASMVGLHLVSVPFHQVTRAVVPIVTIVLSKIFFKKSYHMGIYGI